MISNTSDVVILVAIAYIAFAALAIYVSYLIIHTAITRGLRRHYYWMKEQELNERE